MPDGRPELMHSSSRDRPDRSTADVVRARLDRTDHFYAISRTPGEKSRRKARIEPADPIATYTYQLRAFLGGSGCCNPLIDSGEAYTPSAPG